MDENKREDIVPEQEQAEAAEALAEEAVAEDISDGDGLEAELEELRDMFQQELDKATEKAEAETGELIQELDDPEAEEVEATEPAEEELAVRICECCEENFCADEYGEDYPYCEECRNLMKKYPMRLSGILMSLVMIVIFGATAFVGSEYIDSFMSVSEYAAYYDTGKLMTALNGYYSYLSSASADTMSMKAFDDAIDGFVQTGYISDAASFIETYFSEDELKLPWNKKYVKILESAETMTDSYYTVADIVTPVLNKEETDYDKAIADLDALYEATDDEGNPENVTPAFIEYYKFVVMSVFEKSTQELLAQLEKTAETDDGTMSWIYLANYCGMAAKSGDYELTEKLYNQMIDINSEDTNAYVALASYYRYTETPDPDKMLEICEEAKENAVSGDYGYMPTMAIAYMLKGEGAVALETMDEYMSMAGYTVQTCNLYALCALYNGNEEIYTEMKNVLETSGYKIYEAVEDYKNDKITIEEILTDKEGDI